ncbi:type VI secretion system contractile sheath large subunit [Vibrio alginolyticus]
MRKLKSVMVSKETPEFDDVQEHDLEQILFGCERSDDCWLDNFLAINEPLHLVRAWSEKAGVNDFESFRFSLSEAISRIDLMLQDQVNEILHSPRFQCIERGWVGVYYLCYQLSNQTHIPVKIKLVSATWDEISKDSLKAIEFDQTALFKLLYQNEYGMAGGEPFGLVIGDYQLRYDLRKNHFDRDLSVLSKIAQSAAASFSPFVMSVAPSVFGVDSFNELASIKNISAQFEQIEYARWRELRSQDDTKFLGFVAPDVLFRQPYKFDGSRPDSFEFNERIDNSDKDLLWGSGAYCFAAISIRAFQEYGWFTHMRGIKQGEYNQGVITAPIRNRTQLYGKNSRTRCPLNVKLSERQEQELSDCGFIPISPIPETDMIGMTSNVSLHEPEDYKEKHIATNAKLTSMLQYTLCVSRIAHYIKVMGRNKIGGYQDAPALEREFQAWLHQYTTASDEASEELRAKYPLNEAKISLRMKREMPGHYYSVIHLRPHFQLDQMVSSIKLITELSPEHLV